MLATSALALLLSALPARAGGVGLIAHSGLHQVRAYYYRDDGLQGIDMQERPNLGGGAEFLLGDRDDRVIGVVRFYELTDWRAAAPDLSAEDTANYEYTWPPEEEQPPRVVGVLTAGIQWGIWGDPSGLQVVLHTLAGSAFLTTDSTEFLLLEPGAGVTWAWSDRMQAFGTLSGAVRFRKRFSFGESVYAGVRYMFD